MSNALVAMSRIVTNAAKLKLVINRLELKGALKRVSTQIEINSQTAVAKIRSDLDREDSEALPNVAACRTVSHTRLLEVCCSLSEADGLVVN